MITEQKRKILESEMLDVDSWVDNLNLLNSNDEAVVDNKISVKVDKVLARLISHWTPILESRSITIPSDDNELVELIFAQSDYQTKAEQVAKTPEELFKEAKKEKTAELEVKYRAAQLIKIVNGHTFLIPLAGPHWVTVENACFSAGKRGKADLIWKDINGDVQVLKDLPVAEWDKFYDAAKPIGISNKIIKTTKEIEIASASTIAEVEAINLDVFPVMQQINVNL